MKPTRTLVTGNKILLPFAVALAMAVVSTARAADYPTTILADNPSAYYRFEELPGATTAADSSSNDIPATIYPNNESIFPELGEPGIDTNSILFNGGTKSDFAFVDVPSSGNIIPLNSDNSPAPFSCELWVQPTGQPVSYSVPIEVAQYPNGWNIYVSGADANGGTSYFYLNLPGVLFQGFPDFPISFPSQWYHLVVTYNGSSFMFYINDVAHGPYTATYTPAAGSDAHIGSGQGVGWYPFIGGVDEVAFYTNALTAAQIQTHYQVGTNSFRPPNAAPTIALAGEPASTTNYAGLSTTFKVTASGSLPFHYQWYENSSPIGGNASSVSFISHYPADNGASVEVVITNSFGSITSSIASLTVLTNDVIVSPPGSILRNVGSYAAFHVTAFGAVPITYQWSQSINGGTSFTPITGATNDTLWLSKVQLSENNNQYEVAVNGPFSTTIAPAATLNVQARPVNVPLTGYGAIVAADSPVAYWRLDEASGASTAVDAVGSFDGDYTPAAGTITFGVPPGIPNDTDPAVILANGANIQVPFAPELNPETAWSAETWINPASLGANGGDYRVVLSSEYNEYPFPYNGWYIYQQPNGTLAFVPEPGNAFLTTVSSVVAGSWYHVVITDDGSNFNFYLNGTLAVAPLPVAGADFIPNGVGINPDGSAGITPGLGNTVLGQRTDSAFNTFEGTIDDTAFYNYALTPQQIKNHFLNTTKVSILDNGSSYVITWPTGNLQSAATPAGPYTTIVGATSPYTNTPTGTQKYFRVQVP